MAGNDLPKVEANYASLTPLTFIQRAANLYPDRVAVVYGQQRFTWSQTLDRCRRLASALSSNGISPGDTVVILNTLPPGCNCLHVNCPSVKTLINSTLMWIEI
jgi:non-ribosomal peptide synthetase component E (peptide arylation enzyme)